MITHPKAHKLRYIVHYSIQKLLCAMMEIEVKQQEEKCLARLKKPRHITQCTLNSQKCNAIFSIFYYLANQHKICKNFEQKEKMKKQMNNGK